MQKNSNEINDQNKMSACRIGISLKNREWRKVLVKFVEKQQRVLRIPTNVLNLMSHLIFRNKIRL